jgi:hypothetical protein
LIDEIWDEVAGRMEDGFYVHGEDFVEFVFGDFYRWLGICQQCSLDFVFSLSER